MINRPLYIEKLLEWKDKDIIKVITGMRRCGKSSILDRYIERLLSSGVDEHQIIKINFENTDIHE